ncbi:hypothetical protein NDU88_004177 [Pleurodeles waltl]|uniref:Uncharacterized protein n=1 Tax=Pleurodeles waltl TaxID=8319 RepID=A0AAV7MUQ8_PLEWA|nr:hypothetical protein NDU88_004177 [Pleurodeles waltl]
MQRPPRLISVATPGTPRELTRPGGGKVEAPGLRVQTRPRLRVSECLVALMATGCGPDSLHSRRAGRPAVTHLGSSCVPCSHGGGTRGPPRWSTDSVPLPGVPRPLCGAAPTGEAPIRRGPRTGSPGSGTPQGGFLSQGCPSVGRARSHSPPLAPCQDSHAGAPLWAGQLNPPRTFTVRAHPPGHSSPPAGPSVTVSQRSFRQPERAPGAQGGGQRERSAVGPEAVGHRLRSSDPRQGSPPPEAPSWRPRGSATATKPSARRSLGSPVIKGASRKGAPLCSPSRPPPPCWLPWPIELCNSTGAPRPPRTPPLDPCWLVSPQE